MEEFLDHIPLSEEEVLGLFPKGDYPAIIEKVEVKTSQAGNRCFVGTIEIMNNSTGQTRKVTTWFGLPYLLKHAYDSAGLSSKYESAKLSNKDLEGKHVIARVKIKEGNDKYPQPKNEIYDFIVNAQNMIGMKSTEIIPDFDDKIPF